MLSLLTVCATPSLLCNHTRRVVPCCVVHRAPFLAHDYCGSSLQLANGTLLFLNYIDYLENSDEKHPTFSMFGPRPLESRVHVHKRSALHCTMAVLHWLWATTLLSAIASSGAVVYDNASTLQNAACASERRARVDRLERFSVLRECRYLHSTTPSAARGGRCFCLLVYCAPGFACSPSGNGVGVVRRAAPGLAPLANTQGVL